MIMGDINRLESTGEPHGSHSSGAFVKKKVLSFQVYFLITLYAKYMRVSAQHIEFTWQ